MLTSESGLSFQRHPIHKINIGVDHTVAGINDIIGFCKLGCLWTVLTCILYQRILPSSISLKLLNQQAYFLHPHLFFLTLLLYYAKFSTHPKLILMFSFNNVPQNTDSSRQSHKNLHLFNI